MKRSALIVDDQEDIRRLILMTMEISDFELHEASDGTTALAMTQKLQPDIVLLDAMMPGGLDGYEVCKRIKADPLLQPRTRVILLTAMSQQSDVKRGEFSGCDAYLIKPFSPIELLDTVERLAPVNHTAKLINA